MDPELKVEILIEPPDDLRKVNDFLNSNALKRAGCLPPPMLNRYCVVTEKDEILACAGATLARDRKLHLEKIYNFGHDASKLLLHRAIFCEIGRWFSIDARAALPALRGLIGMLDAEGIRFALCELKKPTVRRAQGMGLHFEKVDAMLDLTRVDPIERQYYADNPPTLYRLDFAKIDW
jgi:hypothetical protein